MPRRPSKNVVTEITEIEEKADEANAAMPAVQPSSGVGFSFPAQSSVPPQAESHRENELRYGRGLAMTMPWRECLILAHPSFPKRSVRTRWTYLSNDGGRSNEPPRSSMRRPDALPWPTASERVAGPSGPPSSQSPPPHRGQLTGLEERKATVPSVKEKEAVQRQTKKRHRIIGLELPEHPPEVQARLAKTRRFQEEANSDDGGEFLSAKSSSSSEYGTARSHFSDEEDSVDSPAHDIPVVTITISGSPPPSPARPPRRCRRGATTLLSPRSTRPPPPVATSPPSAHQLDPASSPNSPRTPTSDSAAGSCESDSSSRKRARTTLRRPRRRRPGTRAPLSSPPSPRTSTSDRTTGGDETDSSSSKRRRTTLELPSERRPDRFGRRRRRNNPRAAPARASLERRRRCSSV